ncbi:hypothetical protein SPRG_15736 [Saprolegnia parasitica CBS 223.65]|uniref:RING-type domain-containing protein n=1 Tax=Saprolegnia parasitica (strain CBS 223.65) TaxID=695850 RepID=A0A067BXM9_SAPPC|nr:hypothetical protein SPRG_15736 [Saprolegnia parasitica CBS 223.65]KDO19071.1 hypothetical protein SPRG_15736 [Saprolegnia parasitica CBS 223.65]|eukprot:XP_012210227.1 hypothetical protein SPRG_15736 [Saprolegnia parasitica CBS 223.65]
MKFGKRMRYLAAPEWEGGYVDYKGLKRTVKSLAGSDAERTAGFRIALQRELAKVNASFFCILDDLGSRETVAQGDIEAQLMAALDLSHRVDALRRFVVLNYLAVVKISKKFDKSIAGSMQAEILASDLLLQPFYAGSYVDDLYSHTAATTDALLLHLLPEAPVAHADASCPICLYHLTSPVTLSCSHSFCWSCLAKAAEHHIHACPLCRQVQSIDPRDYEIDGLLQRFLKRYGTVTSPPPLVARAVDVATKHLESTQLRLSLAPLMSPPPLESIPEVDEKLLLLPRVACIAHPATSRSMTALTNAIAAGCHVLSIDVQLAGDGSVVVSHDNRLILEAMDAGGLSDAGVLSLQHVLGTISGVALYLCVTSDAVILPLMALLEAVCADERSWWSGPRFYIASGNHYQLLAINGHRGAAPALHGLHTVAITHSIPLGYCKSFEALRVSHVYVDAGVVTRPFVHDAHSRGLHVFVGLVNHENVAWKVLEDIGGVDGIATHDPSMLVSTLLHHALQAPPPPPPVAAAASETYSAGDPVEIVGLYDTAKWYPGVILGARATDAGTTYAVLWWMSDNSQRRATKVLSHQLRRPVPQYEESYFGYGIDVAFGALKTALGWAKAPFRSPSD